jgi:Flp pilus assembly protein TadG
MLCWRSLLSALRGEKGSATIEFVLWLPLFFVLIGGVTDAALVMNMQARMFDIARDASQSVSLGNMTMAEAETWVLVQLSGNWAPTVEVSVLDGFVTTDIRAPFSSAIVFGKAFVGENTTRAFMIMVLETPTPPAGAEEGV